VRSRRAPRAADGGALAFRARVITLIAWSGIGALSVSSLVDWLSRHVVPGELWVRLFGYAGCAAMLLALRLRRVDVAGPLLPATILVVITAGAAYRGGLIAPNYVWLAVGIVAAGWLTGPRAMLVAGTATAVAILGLHGLESGGALPPREPVAAVRILSGTLFALLACALAAYAAHREMRRRIDALRESEARFEDFARASGDWFWETDAEGRFTWLSESVEERTGVPAAWHIGKTRTEMAAASQNLAAEPWRSHLEAVAQRRAFRDFRYLRPSPRGEQWVSTSGVPHFGERGEFLGYRGSSSEVTDHVRAEEALRQSRIMFENLFERSPSAISVYTEPEGRIVNCNTAYERLFGRPRADIIGRTGRELAIWSDWSDRERMHALRKHSGSIRDFEAELVAVDGRRFTALVAADTIVIDGRPLVLAQTIDITERKRSERALSESEARFASIFHESLVPQLVSDPASRVNEDVNAAFCALTGYSREQLVGHRGEDLQLFWSRADGEAIGAATRADGTHGTTEIALRRSDGSRRTVLISGFPLDTAGGARLAWTMVDVTEQREAQRLILEMNESLERTVAWRTEELRQANTELKGALDHLKSSQDALLQSEKLAALGRLVAGVAHELNTPIGNSLLSATTLAEYTGLFAAEARAKNMRRSTLEAFVAQSQEAAGILVRNLEKAAHLIASFKQVAADQASSQRRSFALKEVVDEVLLAHRPMLRKSPIQVAADIPASIRLDSFPGPLGQVLGNLITNAVLHGYEGCAGGTVSVSARLDADDIVEIAVRDQGCGISEANLKRIFDPFFTTRLGRGGTGLGLAICHRITAETLGGAIRVQSRPGQGTTFLVRVPLRAALGAGVSSEAA
jgi:PAS domain S-box-containing protein